MASIGKDIQASEEWGRYLKVKSFYSMRDARYRLLLNLLGGNYYSQDLITTQQVTPEQASEITQTTGRTLVVNRLAVVVRNYKNLLSQPPEIDVPPRRDEKGTVTDEAKKHADTLQKLLYATWGSNRMELELQGVAHDTCGLGSAPIKVWPDIENGRMGYSFLRPWTYYPMMQGSDFRRMRYACVEMPMYGEELKATYGNTAFRLLNPGLNEPNVLKDDVLYMTIEYFTPDSFSLIVGEIGGGTINTENVIGDRSQDEAKTPLSQFGPQTIFRVKNIMGFIPIVNIPGNYIPHQAMGESDIYGSVGMNYYVNEMFNTQSDIFAFTANPILIITGSNMAGSDIPNRPGASITLPEAGAKATFLYPPQFAGDYFNQIKQAVQFIEEDTGQPEPVLGRTQAGVESGAAITALLGGVAATVSTKQRIFKVSYEELNAMTLKGYERVFANRKISLHGSQGFNSGEYFALDLMGKDVDGWYANEVIYREGLQDFGQRLVSVLQMRGQDLISKFTARKMLGVRSPLEEEKQILAEKMAEATIETMKSPPRGGGAADPDVDRQGMLRGRMPTKGALPPGAPTAEQMAALIGQAGGGAGGSGSPPSPLPTGGLAPGPSPAPGGSLPMGPTGVTAAIDPQAVKRALGKVRFVGKAYLMGIDEAGIHIGVTNPADKPKVEAALADIGAPVDVQVVSGKQEGARIRGAR